MGILLCYEVCFEMIQTTIVFVVQPLLKCCKCFLVASCKGFFQYCKRVSVMLNAWGTYVRCVGFLRCKKRHAFLILLQPNVDLLHMLFCCYKGLLEMW
jgi:hypothetical protein